MKLLIEGDFTFLKLNTLNLVENLPKDMGQICIMVDIDDHTRQLTKYQIHGSEMLPDKPVFLPEIEL